MATAHSDQSRTGAEPLEKDYGNNGYANGYGNNGANTYHMNDRNTDSDTALKRIRTAGSISISPELFEKIYLSPQNTVKGDLRKTFGNPTPFGSYFFFGGLLMLLGGFLEFILGNTFPFIVFMSFGAFWLSFAATLQPFYAASASYAPNPATSPAEGLATVGFNASFGFFLVFMAVLCVIYLVCSLRTNAVFVVIFFTLVLGFGLLAGAYWQAANGIANMDAAKARLAHRLTVAAGACTFVTSMAGWWIFFAIMLAALDFPFQLPVGDLSTMITGASERARVKQNVV
ncbi:hypothetical protein QTJ16_004619 [Diplocarpon rosae]|uniref:Uncharacterized protein n=1 Tax=Diplocarpon rosae TaxID=946125 RepID=A0AAD9WCD7_9HELO|nr:hypothetical protein QTJ16_004619 [Diplocarpon rosae]